MLETGMLDRKIEWAEYTDTRFSDGARCQAAWKHEPGMARAE